MLYHSYKQIGDMTYAIGLLLILEVVWGAYALIDIRKNSHSYNWEPYTGMYILLNGIGILSVSLALLLNCK